MTPLSEGAFEFGRSLRSPLVRNMLRMCGYDSRTQVILVVGGDPGDDVPPGLFKVWRDDTIPGGWFGRPGPPVPPA